MLKIGCLPFIAMLFSVGGLAPAPVGAAKTVKEQSATTLYSYSKEAVFERMAPRSRLLRSLIRHGGGPPSLTYNDGTIPVMVERIDAARKQVGLVHEGAFNQLDSKASFSGEDREDAALVGENPLSDATLKRILGALMREVLLAGARQTGDAMTVSEAQALATAELSEKKGGYGRNVRIALQRAIDVLRLPGVQKAILAIHALRDQHVQWSESYEKARSDKLEAMDASGGSVRPNQHGQGQLDALIDQIHHGRGDSATVVPFWGETASHYRTRTQVHLPEREIVDALAEDLLLPRVTTTVDQFLGWTENEARQQVLNALPLDVREEESVVEPHVDYIVDAQKKIRGLKRRYAATDAKNQTAANRWFATSPTYGWQEPVLRDVTAKVKEHAKIAQPSGRTDTAFKMGGFAGNLTYQGRAIHLMADQKPVNDLLRGTKWKDDITKDPVWRDDLPTTSIFAAGDKLPFVEVWARYGRELRKLGMPLRPADVVAFIEEFTRENGRAGNGKRALLGAHRYLLEGLARYIARPDQLLRKKMALALVYDLAGYRPEEIAQVVAVDQKVIDEGFARMKQKGIGAYFNDLSMSGTQELVSSTDEQLRWRRGETSPRALAMYLFDGLDSVTIAERLRIPVEEVLSIIEGIHAVGADAYVEKALLQDHL